jgi:hypothetical protein
MPLIFVQRYAPAAAIAAGTGTQTVTGTLTLANPTVVEFDPSVFTVSGTYTIFTYGTLVGSVTDLQADLTGTSFSSAVFADTGSSITVTLS